MTKDGKSGVCGQITVTRVTVKRRIPFWRRTVNFVVLRAVLSTRGRFSRPTRNERTKGSHMYHEVSFHWLLQQARECGCAKCFNLLVVINIITYIQFITTRTITYVCTVCGCELNMKLVCKLCVQLTCPLDGRRLPYSSDYKSPKTVSGDLKKIVYQDIRTQYKRPSNVHVFNTGYDYYCYLKHWVWSTVFIAEEGRDFRPSRKRIPRKYIVKL